MMVVRNGDGVDMHVTCNHSCLPSVLYIFPARRSPALLRKLQLYTPYGLYTLAPTLQADRSALA